MVCSAATEHGRASSSSPPSAKRSASATSTTFDPRQILSSQTWSRLQAQPPEELLLDNLEDWLYSQFGMVPAMVTTTEPIAVGRWGLPEPTDG